MNFNHGLMNAIVLGISMTACITDVRARRIPNWLTFGAAGAAVLWHFLAAGPVEAGFSVLGWVVAVVCFAPVFAVGGLGAGDVKLAGAIGAWLGPAAAFHVVVYSIIPLAVLAFILPAAP